MPAVRRGIRVGVLAPPAVPELAAVLTLTTTTVAMRIVHHVSSPLLNLSMAGVSLAHAGNER